MFRIDKENIHNIVLIWKCTTIIYKKLWPDWNQVLSLYVYIVWIWLL